MRKLLMPFFILFFALCVFDAHGATFSGQTYGIWSDIIATGRSVFSDNNNDIGSISSLNWGQVSSYGTNFDSRITFDGLGSDGMSNWVTSSEAPFRLGRVTYRNGSTLYGTSVRGATLSTRSAITDTLGATSIYDFDMELTMTSTPNITGNPVLDGDIVTITASSSPNLFTFNGGEYIFRLLGFSTDGGRRITNYLNSPEGETISADFYGNIASLNTTAPVPEPTSLFLLMTGFMGIGIKSFSSKNQA